MTRVLVLAALLLLTACPSPPPPAVPTEPPKPAVTLSPQAKVFAIKTGYEAPLTLAVAYNKRPPCRQPTSPVLCRDPAVVAQLRRADDTALSALNAAENIVRTKGVSDNAINLAIATAENATKAVAAILENYGVK